MFPSYRNQLTVFYMMGTLVVEQFPGYTAGSFENVLRIFLKYFQSIFSKFAFQYPVTLIKKVSTKDFTREFAGFFQVNYLIGYLRTTPLSTREWKLVCSRGTFNTLSSNFANSFLLNNSKRANNLSCMRSWEIMSLITQKIFVKLCRHIGNIPTG